MNEGPSDSDLRIHYLATRDIPCPNCGYILRGLTGGYCPECNQRLELAIQLADPHAGSLTVALVALSAGAGAGLLILVIVLLLSFVYQSWIEAGYYWISGLGFVVEGTAVFGLGRRRGRVWFRQLVPTRRRFIVFISCFGTVAFFLSFAWYCVRAA